MTEKRFTIIYNEHIEMMQYVDNQKEEPNRWAIWNANETAQKLNNLSDENEQLKKELKKYTDAFDCSQCRFQNYDWFDDGDEFEVCEKGNNEAQMENHSCSEWEEI